MSDEIRREPDPLEIDPNNPSGYAVEAGPVPPPTYDSSPVPTPAWDAAVGAWIDAHVRNSPIAGATEAWNHLMNVLPRLRTFLETELKSKE